MKYLKKLPEDLDLSKLKGNKMFVGVFKGLVKLPEDLDLSKLKKGKMFQSYKTD